MAKLLSTLKFGEWLPDLPEFNNPGSPEVLNNYILAPYLALLNAGWSLKLDTPPDLWALIKIGMGGYIVGRSGEKIMRAYSGKA